MKALRSLAVDREPRPSIFDEKCCPRAARSKGHSYRRIDSAVAQDIRKCVVDQTLDEVASRLDAEPLFDVDRHRAIGLLECELLETAAHEFTEIQDLGD